MDKLDKNTEMGVFDIVMNLCEQYRDTPPEEDVATITGVEICAEELPTWMCLYKATNDQRLIDTVNFAEQQARLFQQRMSEGWDSELEDAQTRKRDREYISVDMEYLAIRLLCKYWSRRKALIKAYEAFWKEEGAERERAQKELFEAHID